MIFKNSKIYDALKFMTLRVLPPVLTFIGIVLVQFKYSRTEMILIIGEAFITMLGQILGISSNKYHKTEIETDTTEDDELLVERDDE